MKRPLSWGGGRRKKEENEGRKEGRKGREGRIEAHCDADIRTVSRESRRRSSGGRLRVEPAAQGETFLSRISSDCVVSRRGSSSLSSQVVGYVRASSMRDVRPLNNAENSGKKKIKVKGW